MRTRACAVPFRVASIRYKFTVVQVARQRWSSCHAMLGMLVVNSSGVVWGRVWRGIRVVVAFE